MSGRMLSVGRLGGAAPQERGAVLIPSSGSLPFCLVKRNSESPWRRADCPLQARVGFVSLRRPRVKAVSWGVLLHPLRQ